MHSCLADGRIEAVVVCEGERRPRAVTVRLPHPEGRKPTRVTGGQYDPETETVRLAPFAGRATVTAAFGL